MPLHRHAERRVETTELHGHPVGPKSIDLPHRAMRQSTMHPQPFEGKRAEHRNDVYHHLIGHTGSEALTALSHPMYIEIYLFEYPVDRYHSYSLAISTAYVTYITQHHTETSHHEGCDLEAPWTRRGPAKKDK